MKLEDFLNPNSKSLTNTGLGALGDSSYSRSDAFSNEYQELLDQSTMFNTTFDTTSVGTGTSSNNIDPRTGLPSWNSTSTEQEGTSFGDVAMGAADFAGNFVGGFIDSALLGLPGLISDLTGARWIREVITLGAHGENKGWFDFSDDSDYGYENESGAGRWGSALGQGIGMLIPFSAAGKVLTMGGRAATSANKTLFSGMTSSSRRGFASKYLEREGGDQVISAINRVGGASRSSGLLDETTEAFKTGYNTLFKDAWELVNSSAYKGILKNSQKAMREGIDEMTNSILQMSPKLSRKEASGLAQSLISEASHQSMSSMHRMAEFIVTKSPVLGRLSKNDYTKQTLAAYVSDFAVGSTMFAAEAALHNLTVGGVQMMTGETREEVLSRVDPRSKAAHTTHGSFLHILGQVGVSGAWMGLIGPTRFVKGGSSYGGQGLKSSLYQGLKVITKSFKPIGKMSGDQARFNLSLIDEAADGLLHQSFGRLATTKIADLSDDAARLLLKDARKQFASKYSSFMMNEVISDISPHRIFSDIAGVYSGKGIQSALPRMISGAIAMNAQGIFTQLLDNPKQLHHALGNDGHEIAQNIIMGMVFSRSGRTFNTKGKSRLFETGDLRTYYGNNSNDIMKMRQGLELMGVNTGEMGLQQGSMMYEATRQHVRNQPFFKEIHEIVKQGGFYVDRVDPTTTGQKKAAKSAYTEHLLLDANQGGGGLKVNSSEFKIAMDKYDIFEKVLNAYDSSAPDVNLMFRTVDGKEMVELVDNVLNISDVANSKSIDLTINNAKLQAYISENKPYKDVRKNFVIQAFDKMGISIMPDAKGNLIIPEISLNEFGSSNVNSKIVRNTELNNAKFNLQELIIQGEKDGWITVKGVRAPNQSPENIKNFVEQFGKSKLALLSHVYGAEAVKDGAYPMGGKDASELILVNEGMREASLQIDMMEQARNVLTLFSDGKATKTELFNTLPEGKRERIQELLQIMGIDKNPQLVLSDVNPKDHESTIDFFNKVVSLHKLLNPKGNSDKVDVSVQQVESAREAIFDVVGDAISKDRVFNNVESEAFNYFIDQVRANASGSPHSVGLALQHLLNGTRMVDASGNINNNLGKFVIRTSEGLVMADARSLLAKLKVIAPDKAEILEKDGVDAFYQDLQFTIENSGRLVNFTRQSKEIDLVIQGMGADKIVELLSQAKTYSDKGLVKDLINKTAPLEKMQSDVETLTLKLIEKDVINTDKENVVYNDLVNLYAKTKNLVKLMQYAMQNRDYAMLMNLTKSKAEFDLFFNNLNEFLKLNPLKEGNIDLEWQQGIAEHINSAQNFLNKNYGDINLQNYSKFVTEQMGKNFEKLPGEYKKEEMLTNISPAQFEGRYGMPVSTVKTVIETHRNLYNKTKDVAHIDNAYNDLFDRVKKSQSKLEENKKRSDEEISIDVLQTVLTAVGTKEVGKLKWVGDKFILSKTYLVNQDKQGVLGVAKLLDLDNQFYVLDKEMIMPGIDGKMKAVRNPNEAELNIFTAQIASQQGGIYIDNPQARIDMKKGLVGNHINKHIKPENYLYIPLDETISIVVPRQAAKEAVIKAFSEGGSASVELKKHFTDVNNPRLVEALSKFSDPSKLTNTVIESAILTARLLIDAPHVVVDKIDGRFVDMPTIKDIWKRLKLPEFSKGRLYTPEMLEYLSGFYKANKTNSDFYTSINKSFDHFRTSTGWREMNFISIADEGGESYFNSYSRLEKWMDLQEKTAGQKLWTNTERSEILATHEKSAKSMVDAPTYLTKENFIFHMAQMGMRRDWLHIENGEIVGFKSGAMKPKGVNVKIGNNGEMQVWYDKTAFFYDAKMDALMKTLGLDGIAFESGNKINKHRVDNTHDIVDRYINSDKGADGFSDTIFGDIVKVANRNGNNDIIKLPLSTFNITNISREHSAKSGANMAVHTDNNPHLAPWMRLDTKIRDFEAFLTRANSSEYALTSIAQELMGIKSKDGDLMLGKVPVESIVAEGGLIMDQWMGDVVADKLFTYFFEGSKIATGTVGNSSISPMAPPIHQDLSRRDLAIRNYETVVDGNGKTVKVGRQKIIGDYQPDSFHLDAEMSFNGKSNIGFGKGDVNNANEGAFFVRRISIKLKGELKTGDFTIIPMKAKKGGEQEWAIVGMGYELRGDKVIDLNVASKKSKSTEYKEDNLAVHEEILRQANEMYVDLQNQQIKNGGLTNRDAVIRLATNHSNFKLGILNNRQPRNLINDVVINKISATEIIDNSQGPGRQRKIITAGDKRMEGNKSEQNFVDAIESQDSDYDYDKSSAYLSAPGSFVKNVAKNAGYGIKNDSYAFAETFFATLNTQLDNNSSMKRQLAIVNNSAGLRGRLVKMHNIVGYFKNAFESDNLIGTFNIGNDTHTIRMKGTNEYMNTADNIASWAKIFIDNYKNPTDIMNIDKLIKHILFGSKDSRTDGSRHYEGMFEITNKRTNERVDYIDGEFVDIRRVIYQKMVAPISKYLRYNRGMTENQQGESNSLRLKDIANGFETLQKELDNPYIYDNNWQFSIGKKTDFSLNIRNGMQTLSDYVIGGWGETPHAGASQNPFDVAMRTLTQVYNRDINGKNRIKTFAEVQDIMNQAEAGILLESQGIQAFDRAKITDALWKHIKNDYDYIEVSKLHYRVEALKKQREFLSRDKYSQESEIRELDSKIAELGAIKGDIELKLGGQYEYEAGKSTFKLGYQKAKTYTASRDVVFWDSEGNIKMSLAKGDVNAVDIKSDWVAILNPRRFALVNPEIQRTMHAKLTAFSSMPMETNPSVKDVTFMNKKDHAQKIVPLKAAMDAELRVQKDRFKNKKIDGFEFSVNKKAIINKYLNDESLTSPLERKALLWETLRPIVDNSRVSYFKTNEGLNVNSHYMFDNPLAKTSWQLLLDITSQESFAVGNKITKLEATNLAKEIVGRQTLALLGIKNPHLEVTLDYEYGGYNQTNNRNLYIELNRKELVKLPGFDAEAERAMTILNDFVHGERLLTPGQVLRLEQKAGQIGPDFWLTNSNAKDHMPARPKRVFGKPTETDPVSLIRDINRKKREKRRKECPGL